MRLRVLVLLVVCACGTQPAPTQPVNEPRPLLGSAQPLPPSGSPLPPCPPPKPAEGHSSVSLRGFIPSGFWCGESRKTPKDSPINICYSTQNTCQVMRKRGLDAGGVMGICTEKNAAHCFTMIQDGDQKIYWRCYETHDECESRSQEWAGEYPKLRFGQCDVYSRSVRME